MKRWVLLIVVLFTMVVAACKQQEEQLLEPQITEETVDNQLSIPQFVQDEKGVAITIPSEYIDLANARYEKEEVIQIKNNDGSVTYRMSTSYYEEQVSELAQKIERDVKALDTDEESESVKGARIEKEYTFLMVEIDQKLYENSFDAFKVFNILFECAYYQMFTGVEDVGVDVQYIDASTQQIIKTLLYPEDYVKKEMEEQF